MVARLRWFFLVPLVGSILVAWYASTSAQILYDGIWEGTTRQGDRVFFVAEFGLIKSFIITLRVEGQECAARYTASHKGENLGIVSNDTFTITVDTDAEFLTAEGFLGGQTASGSVYVETRPGMPNICSGAGSTTWRAMRQAPPLPPTPTPLPQPQPTLPIPSLPDTGVDPTYP
ncbi:MAG: hypothetical protein HC837_06640 [Chloroflexaceae bacterium]|nr:hypothetical protein [Chloroflexaceae bacterium]